MESPTESLSLITTLPREILSEILTYCVVSTRDYYFLGKVCPAFARAIEDPSLYKILHITDTSPFRKILAILEQYRYCIKKIDIHSLDPIKVKTLLDEIKMLVALRVLVLSSCFEDHIMNDISDIIRTCNHLRSVEVANQRGNMNKTRFIKLLQIQNELNLRRFTFQVIHTADFNLSVTFENDEVERDGFQELITKYRVISVGSNLLTCFNGHNLTSISLTLRASSEDVTRFFTINRFQSLKKIKLKLIAGRISHTEIINIIATNCTKVEDLQIIPFWGNLVDPISVPSVLSLLRKLPNLKRLYIPRMTRVDAFAMDDSFATLCHPSLLNFTTGIYTVVANERETFQDDAVTYNITSFKQELQSRLVYIKFRNFYKAMFDYNPVNYCFKIAFRKKEHSDEM